MDYGLSGWNTCSVHDDIFKGLHLISHDLELVILFLLPML